MKRNIVVASLIVGAAVGLVACGAGSEEIDLTSNLGGDGLPVQKATETYGHNPVLLSGQLLLQDGGCWTLNLGDAERLVVFPAGYSKPLDNALVMVSPDGLVVESEMLIDATGGVVSTLGFPGVPDGYWGNYLDFCNPELEEFVVLDSIEPAFGPEELTDDQLVAILKDSSLSEAWPCGHGFTTSSKDQHVALMIYPKDPSQQVSAPVSLPDDEWVAEVVVGKLLMAQWCDDVMESWEPLPVEVARWPLSAGELDFTPPSDSGSNAGCKFGVPVPATLSSAQVETPQGPIELGDLALVNNAYGCYAG